MKKYFYFAFSLFVVLAACVIADKYRKEYNFKHGLRELVNLGLTMDKQADELAKAIGQSIAYQMTYPKDFLEEGKTPEQFLQETAEQFSRGAITKEQVLAYADEALKNTAKFKSPEEDKELAELIAVKTPAIKANALEESVRKQQALEGQLIYELKEQEMPLDALFWANELKTKNIPAETLDTLYPNWIGDEKQNKRLVDSVKRYIAKGKVRPLTQKEQALQSFYSNRIGQVLNPQLQEKEQIAALSPDICTDLMSSFWASQIADNQITVEALQEAQAEWAKEDAFKVKFMDKLTQKVKENKPRRLSYLETLQLNTCNNM